METIDVGEDKTALMRFHIYGQSDVENDRLTE